MDRSKALEAATVFLSGYAKRWMESNYDRLMATQTGHGARSLDTRIRYAIEASLYALLVVMDRQLPDSTAIERLVKGIALDAPSEVAKRLINGIPQPVAGPREDVHERAILSLLGIEETALSSFLSWFASLDHRDRDLVLHMFQDLNPGQFLSFVSLGPAVRSQFVDALRNATPAAVKKDKPSILHDLRIALEKQFGQRSAQQTK